MRTISIKLLPDKSGKVRIHWFQRDDLGPITTPSGIVPTGMGPMQLGGTKGRIVCQPELNSINPQMTRGVLQPTIHSDDIRAVTCPECLASAAAQAEIVALNEVLNTAPVAQG